MPRYESTREIAISAAPQRCFDTLTDYERLPSWQTGVSRCRVLARDERGRGTEIEYVIDVKLRQVTYRLRQFYEEPQFIGSEYVSGDFRSFDGFWRFAPAATGTQATFHLAIDPGMRLPGAMVSMLGETVMGRALRDLKNEVEGG